MKRLVINNKGELFIDDIQVLRKDITGELLFDICKAALKKELEFDIDPTDPISTLFIRINDETKEDSEFSLNYNALKKEYETLEHEKDTELSKVDF